MKFKTNLDMDSVQAEIIAELEKMRAAGVPMVHIENGKVVEVKVLKASTETNSTPVRGYLSAAE